MPGVRASGLIRVERCKTVFVLGSVLIIALLSLPALSLRLGISDAGNDPEGTTTRAAYDLLAHGFGPGSNGPLVLVAQQGSPADGPALDTLISAVRATPGVVSVAVEGGATVSGLSMIDVVSAGAPQDEATATWSGICVTTSSPRRNGGAGLPSTSEGRRQRRATSPEW